MQHSLIAALADEHRADLRRAAAAHPRLPARPSRLRRRAGWWLVRRGIRLAHPGLAVTLVHQ